MFREYIPHWISFLYRKDGYFFAQILINILFIGAVFLYIYQNTKMYHGTQDIIPLHYTIYLGIDFLDVWYHIFFLPILTAFIFLLHWILAMCFYKKQKLASYLLLTFASMFQITSGLYAFLIIRLNT